MNMITIHTDGSCQTQTRIGGWAAILQLGEHRRELSGSAVDTTVNAMELTAAIEGLSALKWDGLRVQIISDSTYLVQGATEWLPEWMARGWRTSSRAPVANRVLWERLHELMQYHEVTFRWIERHHNAAADRLAQAARHRHGQVV